MRTKESGSWTLRSHVLAGHGPTLPRHLGKLLQISRHANNSGLRTLPSGRWLASGGVAGQTDSRGSGRGSNVGVAESGEAVRGSVLHGLEGPG